MSNSKTKKIGNHIAMPTRMINIADLRLNPENERDYIADSPENVTLRQSLASEGVKTLLKVYEDGTVHDGNRRLFNLGILKNEGVEIPGGWDLPAVLVDRPATVVEAVFDRLNTNEAAQFSAIEQGRAFAKLRDAGLNNSEIAKRSPFTSMHVGNMLTLHDAAEDIRTAVRDGKVSATLAVETIRKHGEDILREAMDKAFEAGANRTTQRHVDAVVASKAPPAPTPAPAPATVAAPVPTTTPTVAAPFDTDGAETTAPAAHTGDVVDADAAANTGDVVDADVVDADPTPPSPPVVESEAEVTPATPASADTSRITPRSLLLTIIPVVQELASALANGTKAEKAEAFAQSKDSLTTFLAHAKELGLIKD